MLLGKNGLYVCIYPGFLGISGHKRGKTPGIFSVSLHQVLLSKMLDSKVNSTKICTAINFAKVKFTVDMSIKF